MQRLLDGGALLPLMGQLQDADSEAHNSDTNVQLTESLLCQRGAVAAE